MALTDESNGNGFYMPVAPAYGVGNGFGNGGFGGDWGWIILLLLCGWGGGGFGMGGFGGQLGFDFPWLLNGQNGINNNVSDGFRSAQLSDAVTSVRDGMRVGSYRGSYARNGRGRGRNARRDSMGRYSSEGYSRAAADMTAELQDMMDDPKYEPVRHDIERLMRKVEQM